MLYFLAVGGQHAVRAQVHCGFGVVVGPSARHHQAEPGARHLFSAESFRDLPKFRIVHFAECVGAEIE